MSLADRPSYLIKGAAVIPTRFYFTFIFIPLCTLLLGTLTLFLFYFNFNLTSAFIFALSAKAGLRAGWLRCRRIS